MSLKTFTTQHETMNLRQMKPYYQDKSTTIYLGDCLDLLGNLQADLLLTDPPYGLKENAQRVAGREKLAKTTNYGSFDWDSKPASKEHIQACLKSSPKCIIWGGNYFHLPPARGWLVWDKVNSGDFADCELAWTNLNMSVRLFRHMWNGMLRDSERVPRYHPTQKPIVLMRWCIGLAGEIETIVDPFMGSGTTLRAAKDLGVKAIGIDKEERYCEIAVKRLAQESLFP